MDSSTFVENVKLLAEYIVRYMNCDMKEEHILVNTKELPGYLKKHVPKVLMHDEDSMENILSDYDKYVKPHLLHWLHPKYHAYFEGVTNYESVLGEMLTTGTGFMTMTWDTSPAGTELELRMMDWYQKIIDLPDIFNYEATNGIGGGVLMASASDAIYVALLAARYQAITSKEESQSEIKTQHSLELMVAYFSKYNHSSVMKACMLGMIRIQELDPGENMALTGDILEDAILTDMENGFIPFFCCGSCGSTTAATFDKLEELGFICEKYNLWFHIDGAYGAALGCVPEQRYMLNGVEFADSINTNPYKTMQICPDGAILYVKNLKHLEHCFNQINEEIDEETPREMYKINLEDMSPSSVRRTRALKYWVVIRTKGVEGFREHVRKVIREREYLEQLIAQDKRFEIVVPPTFSLICVRYCVGPEEKLNDYNERLHRLICNSHEMFLSPGEINGKVILRYNISTVNDDESRRNISSSWELFQKLTTEFEESSLCALVCTKNLTCQHPDFYNPFKDEDESQVSLVSEKKSTGRSAGDKLSNAPSSIKSKTSKIASKHSVGKKSKTGYNGNKISNTMPASVTVSKLGSITSEPSKTGSIYPDPSKSGSIYPDPSKTGSIHPDPSKTASVHPDPSKTESIHPEPSKAESVHPDEPEVQTVQPEPLANDTAEDTAPIKEETVSAKPSNASNAKSENIEAIEQVEKVSNVEEDNKDE